MTEFFTNMKMFFISIALFVFIILFCAYIYNSYSSPLDLKANKKNLDIEVSLPVLEWTKYTNLTKDIGHVLGAKISRSSTDSSDEMPQFLFMGN